MSRSSQTMWRCALLLLAAWICSQTIEDRRQKMVQIEDGRYLYLSLVRSRDHRGKLVAGKGRGVAATEGPPNWLRDSWVVLWQNLHQADTMVKGGKWNWFQPLSTSREVHSILLTHLDMTAFSAVACCIFPHLIVSFRPTYHEWNLSQSFQQWSSVASSPNAGGVCQLSSLWHHYD